MPKLRDNERINAAIMAFFEAKDTLVNELENFRDYESEQDWDEETCANMDDTLNALDRIDEAMFDFSIEREESDDA